MQVRAKYGHQLRKNMNEKKTEGQRITKLINSDAIMTVPPERIKDPKVTSIEAFIKRRIEKPPSGGPNKI